jgi:hypothetical protein
LQDKAERVRTLSANSTTDDVCRVPAPLRLCAPCVMRPKTKLPLRRTFSCLSSCAIASRSPSHNGIKTRRYRNRFADSVGSYNTSRTTRRSPHCGRMSFEPPLTSLGWSRTRVHVPDSSESRNPSSGPEARRPRAAPWTARELLIPWRSWRLGDDHMDVVGRRRREQAVDDHMDVVGRRRGELFCAPTSSAEESKNMCRAAPMDLQFHAADVAKSSP